ncbi:MAG: ATP-binding protein [Fusobacteriaceae bacterium]
MEKNLTISYRIISFFILIVVLLMFSYIFNGSIFPTKIEDVVLYSSAFMILVIVLFVEHYFAKPNDVITASVSLILLLLPSKSGLIELGSWYWGLLFYSILMMILSLVTLNLFVRQWTNRLQKISGVIKFFVTEYGNGKTQFFFLFIVVLFFYTNKNNSSQYISLFLIVSIVAISLLKILKNIFKFKNKVLKINAIGEIFGVQSKKIFLVKIFEESTSTKIFDFVEFKYSGSDDGNKKLGIVLEKYFLDKELWIKIFEVPQTYYQFNETVDNKKFEKNLIYKSTVLSQGFLDKFVGLVFENSDISLIKFIYNSKIIIEEGRLLEVEINEEKILYQVIQGKTSIENLERKNDMGYIVGEAIQIGIWKTNENKFEKFGWVPEINSPIFLAKNIEPVQIRNGDYIIGHLPNTNFPLILNKELAITHHTAILGVTGSGKSVFSRELVKKFLEDENTKIICVDFTYEWKKEFQTMNIQNILSVENETAIRNDLEIICNTQNIVYAQENAAILSARERNKVLMENVIHNILSSEDKLYFFELPEVSNTQGTFEYTKLFFDHLFKKIRENHLNGSNGNKKICIVLEEAHTIIPENNFSGSNEKISKPLVNTIAQVALQGRKYGVGFLVIAQRTANVSKTVLTQCNTIISFQQFDDTSVNFLSNYFGGSYAKILPNLKSRHAIAVGKALKSNIPMVFKVPDIDL